MAAEDVDNTSSLPPYSEMILTAIAALNEKDGSNKTSISTYIESKYGNLPADHATVLAQHLNEMKDSGELVFLKNNYAKPDPDAPPKRGRGRPPKPKVTPSTDTAVLPGRPRGRPPKDPNVTPKPLKPIVGSGKPRGRPRKIIRAAEGLSVASTTTSVPKTAGSGRGRGRPPKVKVAPAAEVSVSI